MARLILMLVAVMLAGVTEPSLGQGTTTQTQQPRPPSSTPSPYAALDGRRQKLIDEWGVRFTQATGQKLAVASFYDDIVSLSAKTTFEAVTHALMMSRLTDPSGAPLGDALALVERVEAVKGEVAGVPGDQQFRMYVRLRPDALGTLEQSTECSRGADNSGYHRGYPINYRQQGQVPAIQFSVAIDERRADIDVDYRSSSFPAGLFNGHLTASNSDVRAGDNYDRHINRWTGFTNWWQSFFGVGGQNAAEATPE